MSYYVECECAFTIHRLNHTYTLMCAHLIYHAFSVQKIKIKSEGFSHFILVIYISRKRKKTEKNYLHDLGDGFIFLLVKERMKNALDVCFLNVLDSKREKRDAIK